MATHSTHSAHSAHSAEGNQDAADLALAVYLQEVCDGRTVLWIGEGERAPDHLGRVARQVRVQRRVPKLDRGSVDVVVVPDLEGAGLAEPEAIAELARALGRDGALVAGVAIGGDVDYERLFALTSAEFASVRMLGQSRFRGFALVDFDAEPDEHDRPTLDGSLVDTDQPERYVALCAGSPARLDAYAVIRVPETRRRRRRRSAPPPALDDGASSRLSQIEAELHASNDHAEGLEADLAARTTELEGIRNRLEDVEGGHERALSEIGARLEAETDRVRALEEAVVQASASSAVRDHGESGADEGAPEGHDSEGDYVAIERLLADRGRALAEAEDELERRATLVRDLVEELRSLSRGELQPTLEASTSGAPELADEALTTERDRAVGRALEAEAARAEAQFAVDELMGELSVQAEKIETLATREADLSGRVRGLTSRWAETDELGGVAAARQILAEHDLAAAQRANHELERELLEVRERLELEMVRSRGGASAMSEKIGLRTTAHATEGELAALRASEIRLGERVSELSGQLMAVKDLQSLGGDPELREQLGASQELIGTLTTERDLARAENIRLTVMVGGLEDRFEGARRGYELRIAEITHDLSMAGSVAPGARPGEGRAEARDEGPDRARMDALEGELRGLRARLADREAALAALRAATAGSNDDLRDEADRLRVQTADLKDRETDLTVRLADAEELSELEANRANDLASTIAARDALVNRLSLDLANEERRARESEEAADRIREEAERLREAVVGASERVGETDALEARARELTDALERVTTRAETHGGRMEAAEEVLREAREVLGGLAADLAEEGAVFGKTAVGIEGPDSGWNEPASEDPRRDGGEAGRLSARLDAMEREAADRETLLHSVTAQLEERDERLRSLEGGAFGAGADDALRRNLLELEERAARLSEELAHQKRARREAEAAASGRRSEELKELHDTLGDRDAELLVLRGQVSSAERATRTFREAALEARTGLEELLGAATAQGDPATAERVGALLRLLSRIV